MSAVFQHPLLITGTSQRGSETLMVSIRPYTSSMVGNTKHSIFPLDFVGNVLAGEFPGPTLEARTGDQLIIVVLNQLEDGEGVAFHWHGLHMRGMLSCPKYQSSPLKHSRTDANRMDGVVGVTQKAIPAGEEFTYKFEISKTQSGTFW